VIGRARLVGSPQKRFFHDPQGDSALAAVAVTRGLQSTRQARLFQVSIHLGLVFVFCCLGAGRVKTAGRRRTTRLHDALFHKPSRSVGRASVVTSLDEPRAA
jgi:hypothetical protein